MTYAHAKLTMKDDDVHIRSFSTATACSQNSYEHIYWHVQYLTYKTNLLMYIYLSISIHMCLYISIFIYLSRHENKTHRYFSTYLYRCASISEHVYITTYTRMHDYPTVHIFLHFCSWTILEQVSDTNYIHTYAYMLNVVHVLFALPETII